MTDKNKSILTSKIDEKVLECYNNKPNNIVLNKIKKPVAFINKATKKMKAIDKAKDIEKQYLKGKEKLENEAFDSAIEIFESLDNYKDSKELLAKAYKGQDAKNKAEEKLYKLSEFKRIGMIILRATAVFLPIILYILVVILASVYYDKLQVFSNSYAFVVSGAVFIVIYLISVGGLIFYLGGGCSKRAAIISKTAVLLTHVIASLAMTISLFATSSNVFRFEPTNVEIALTAKVYDSANNKNLLKFSLTNHTNAEIYSIHFRLYLREDGSSFKFHRNGYTTDFTFVGSYKDCKPEETIYFNEDITNCPALNKASFLRLNAHIDNLYVTYESYVDDRIEFFNNDYVTIKEQN